MLQALLQFSSSGRVLFRLVVEVESFPEAGLSAGKQHVEEPHQN
jgi:hypothetical protein